MRDTAHLCNVWSQQVTALFTVWNAETMEKIPDLRNFINHSYFGFQGWRLIKV